jgi:hypothetical protein
VRHGLNRRRLSVIALVKNIDGVNDANRLSVYGGLRADEVPARAFCRPPARAVERAAGGVLSIGAAGRCAALWGRCEIRGAAASSRIGAVNSSLRRNSALARPWRLRPRAGRAGPFFYP